MIRKIIRIDEDKCNGCGLCATACHEGAIEMINGKAVLTRENYCDGLGDCLPGCPTGAITFEMREAPAYDEAAVLASKAAKGKPVFGGCPGMAARSLKVHGLANDTDGFAQGSERERIPGQLRQWPVQIKLVPLSAPWFDGADVLIAADCTAYAYGNFHRDFIKDHVTLIGCPKLDSVDYSEKLAAIFAGNAIHSVTLTRMMVPCCGGMEMAVKRAIAASGKALPLRIVTIDAEGKILRDVKEG